MTIVGSSKTRTRRAFSPARSTNTASRRKQSRHVRRPRSRRLIRSSCSSLSTFPKPRTVRRPATNAKRNAEAISLGFHGSNPTSGRQKRHEAPWRSVSKRVRARRMDALDEENDPAATVDGKSGPLAEGPAESSESKKRRKGQWEQCLTSKRNR